MAFSETEIAETGIAKEIVREVAPDDALKHIIPKALVYEMWQGKSVYYRGYEQYLSNPLEMEKCMGSSVYQSLVISTLLKFLFTHLPDEYQALTNELGLLIAKNDWRNADIAICAKALLATIPEGEQNQYLHFAPKIVIEIDTKADVRDFASVMDYYADKTDDLLDFGVERVIWIFTGAKKVMTATKNNPWQIVDWSASVEILEGLNVSLERDLDL